MRRKILSDEEINKVWGLDFTDEELVRYFTIDVDDVVKVGRVNKDWNKVGFLLQKYILKCKGYNPSLCNNIPKRIIDYICEQIGVNSHVDLSKYSRTVRLKDAENILNELGYKRFKLTEDVKERVYKIAYTSVSEGDMVMSLTYYLRLNKIAIPARYTVVEKILFDAIQESDNYIYTKIVEQVDNVASVESLLEVQEGRFSSYYKVKDIQNRGIEDIETKIKILESYYVDIDLSFISERKLQSIYADVISHNRVGLQRLRDNKKRIVYIIVYIREELKRLEDELITIDREQEKNKCNKVWVTHKNIKAVFKRFVYDVVGRKQDYDERVLVTLFLDLVIYENIDESEILEQGYCVCNREIVYIDVEGYRKFINDIIINKYTDKEKRRLIEFSDTLKSIESRRIDGEYYTKNEWVDEANEIIEQYIGTSWKNDYVVWDCASGKGGLTNGYEFKELYSSTLNEEDLKYVEGSTIFQLDFLNDNIEDKVPANLLRVLKENKPVVFFINPPYVSNAAVIEKEGIRVVVPSTKVGMEMKGDGLGVSANQYYTNFLYKIMQIKRYYNLNNLYIGVFAPTTYIQGARFSSFRSEFLKEFNFESGFLFESSKGFSDINGRWDISFTILSSGECKNKQEFLFLEKERDTSGNIKNKGIRVLTNRDRETN